jgi:hypothetical protein
MIRVLSATFITLPMRTRLPFRYGIVTLREIEHCVVQVRARIDGVESVGLAADGLAPKWFTKNPATSIADDVAEMKRVIVTTCEIAQTLVEAESVFEFWQGLYAEAHIAQAELPGLLVAFGVSLIERALIDAFCRAKAETFAQAVHSNLLGIRLDAIHAELQGREPRDLLPLTPLRSIAARHTVGLIDPLAPFSSSSPDEEGGVADSLPVTLEDCIQAYGLTHFKIKLCGDAVKDLTRLRDVAEVIQRNCRTFAFTLDGNEQYKTVDAFRESWQSITASGALAVFMERLLFVEQPLHRDVALSDVTGDALLAWPARPPIIIDESDGNLDSLSIALMRGYAGTSHKNCKGVFKGIANACLAHVPSPSHFRGGRGVIVSGEDLTNVGPIALTQDLAVMATLDIAHVERNGHHYFKGLSMFTRDLQQHMVEQHGDLYRWQADDFATVNINNGSINVGSVVDAPFGYAITPDLPHLADVADLFKNA